MKGIVTTLVVIAVLGLMALTNPDLDAYQTHQQQRIQEKANRHGEVAAAIGAVVSGVGASAQAHTAVRSNYVFFSTFKSSLADSGATTVGVLGQFFVVGSPDSKSTN